MADNQVGSLHEKIWINEPIVLQGDSDMKNALWTGSPKECILGPQEVMPRNRDTACHISSYGRSGRGSMVGQKSKPTSSMVGLKQNKWFRGNQGKGVRKDYSYPECPRCKKHHPGECNRKACFLCGMVGHFKRNCPQAKKDKQKLEVKPVLAQTFVITQADVASSPSMVKG